jgi:hypothetical protein
MDGPEQTIIRVLVRENVRVTSKYVLIPAGSTFSIGGFEEDDSQGAAGFTLSYWDKDAETPSLREAFWFPACVWV